MYISKDLYVIEGSKFVLIYNYFCNRACFVEIDFYNSYLLNKNEINISRIPNIDNSDINYLLKNGVIFYSLNEYNEKNYSKRIDARNTDLAIRDVYLHLTLKCNLHCSYCYNKDNLNVLTDELSTQQVFEIIDKLLKIKAENIILTGGEVLLREDIIPIIKYINQAGLSCQVLTNGVLIKRILSVIYMLDSIIISLDTLDSNINERNGLNISEIKNNLLSIDKRYRKKIYLRSVISKQNKQSRKKVRSFAIDNGFSFTSTIRLPNNKNEILDMPDINNIDLSNETLNFSGNLCAGAYREIAIDSKGDIYPCQSLLINKYKITNIFNENWYTALDQSGITNDFRKINISKIEGCSDCKVKYLCGGGCRAISVKLYNDLFSKSIPLCKYHKKIVDNKLKNLLSNFEIRISVENEK